MHIGTEAGSVLLSKFRPNLERKISLLPLEPERLSLKRDCDNTARIEHLESIPENIVLFLLRMRPREPLSCHNVQSMTDLVGLSFNTLIKAYIHSCSRAFR